MGERMCECVQADREEGFKAWVCECDTSGPRRRDGVKGLRHGCVSVDKLTEKKGCFLISVMPPAVPRRAATLRLSKALAAVVVVVLCGDGGGGVV